MEVLLAALVRGDQVEWPFTGTAAEQQFLDAAQRHGVVPLVAWQHRRRGSLNDWPAALRSAIAARARQHAIVEQLQRSELAAVVGELTLAVGALDRAQGRSARLYALPASVSAAA